MQRPEKKEAQNNMKKNIYNIDVTIEIYSNQITSYEIEKAVERTLKEMKIYTTTPTQVGVTKIEQVEA